MRFFLYIDPATGGLLLQLLFGGVAGAAVFFRVRLRRMFGRGDESALPDIDAAESET